MNFSLSVKKPRLILCITLVGIFVFFACAKGGEPPSPEALSRSARYGEIDKALVLLDAGADYAKPAAGYGVTPLHWAAMDDNPEVVEAILRRARKDGRLSEILDTRDAWNCTPLMMAAAEGNTQVVEVLVQAGAGINLRGSGGDTALHLAVLGTKKSAQRVVKHLVAAGADTSLTNQAGKNVTEWALRYGRADMAALISGKEEVRP